MTFKFSSIQFHELGDLIEFDTLHLVEVMKKIGISTSKCSLPLDYNELVTAYQRKDTLLWLFSDEELAGYIWRTHQPTHLFSAGAAIKEKFYGFGLSGYIAKLTEQIAKNAGLNLSQLTVIPENGRAVSAFMKQGYQIIKCVSASRQPYAFRCLMEKNFQTTNAKKLAIDAREIACTDEESLKKITDEGYVGTRFIKLNAHDFTQNKILFELF